MKIPFCRAASLAALMTAVPGTAPAQTIESTALHLADASRIADEAVNLAENGPPVAVAIVNAEGNIVALQRMDGTSFINLQAAEQKARTAVALGASTKQAEQGLNHGDLSLLAIGGMLPMAGGVPILLDGRVIGGIGISGRKPIDDDLLAVEAGHVSRRGSSSVP